VRVNPAKVVALLIAIGLPLFVTVTVEQGEQGDAVLLPGSGVPPFGVNLRGAGSSLPGFQGCPLMVLFFARRRRRRAKREKEVFRGPDTLSPRQRSPNPGKGLAALCNPTEKSLS